MGLGKGAKATVPSDPIAPVLPPLRLRWNSWR